MMSGETGTDTLYVGWQRGVSKTEFIVNSKWKLWKLVKSLTVT